MRERLEPVLKALCLVLGGLVVLQLVFRVPHLLPLGGLKIPALPTLAQAETNAPSTPRHTGPTGLAAVASAKASLTNNATKTNAPSSVAGPVTASTNLTQVETNSPPKPSPSGPTGLAGLTNRAIETNSPNSAGSSRALTAKANLTNSPGPKSLVTSNIASITRSNAPPVAQNAAGPRANGRPQRPGPRATELPPDILARVDRVVDSELFGQVMHPMPLALLGIAGDMAFLRAPTGQSGAIKQGESLGAIKLLRIGINRVLVENDGKKEELTIFDGFGGESLLPK